MVKGLLAAAGAMVSLAVSPGVVAAGAGAAQGGLAHDFTFQAINGKPLPMSQFKGRVVLVVNTASLCGFTHQYEGLQGLYATYGKRGLVVVGVPSNNFGGQEPKSDGEIADFCKGAFGVTFPLTSKTDVVGPNKHAFYRWAHDTLGASAAPRWNFHKYLVGADGRLISSFSTTVGPKDAKLTLAIEAALEGVSEDAAAANPSSESDAS